MSNKPKIMIGTPAYGGMVHIDYLSSISDYYRNALNFNILAIGNESLITRARNAILSKFHHSPDYSHLLFLDDDVSLSAYGLNRLISHRLDVVGASVALKTLNQRNERVFNIGPCLGENGLEHEVTWIGTAALLLSRAAVSGLVNDALQYARVYERPGLSRGSSLPERHYDVFQVGVVNGEYLSEDFWICYRLRELGYKIYTDTGVLTRHNGITGFCSIKGAMPRWQRWESFTIYRFGISGSWPASSYLRGLPISWRCTWH